MRNSLLNKFRISPEIHLNMLRTGHLNLSALVRVNEELLERKSSGSGLEN
jgi:hypothetical protein